MGAGRTSRQQGKKKEKENYFNDSILGASRWSKCETGFKYLYSRHFTGRVNTRSIAKTVSQWRCITALKWIKWLGTKETSEAWNYWRDKKKTLMNYCNWLLSYYKLVFLKYNSCGVFQWWFKGFAVNKRSKSLQEKVLTPSCKQVINTGVHRQRPALDNLLTRGESAPLTAGLNCSSTPHADCWLSKGASL